FSSWRSLHSALRKNAARRTWWSQSESNRRPQACKASALPTELWPRSTGSDTLHSQEPTTAPKRLLVGLGRFELPTSRLSSARSNQLSYRPESRIIHEKKEKRRRRRPACVHSHRPDSLTGT